MKKYLSLCALLCVLALMTCAAALAADECGICGVRTEENVSAVPAGTDDGKGAYDGAEQLTLTYSAAQNGKQYLVMALAADAKSEDGAFLPTRENIVYIDQTAEIGAADSKAVFSVYPSELKTGTYYVCMSSNADNGVRSFAQVASFDFYRYGDPTSDGKVDISDVQRMLNNISQSVSLDKDSGVMKASDVTGDGKFDISDVQRMLNYISRSGEGVTLGK